MYEWADIFRDWQMIADKETCIGCGECVFIFTVCAIGFKEVNATAGLLRTMAAKQRSAGGEVK